MVRRPTSTTDGCVGAKYGIATIGASRLGYSCKRTCATGTHGNGIIARAQGLVCKLQHTAGTTAAPHIRTTTATAGNNQIIKILNGIDHLKRMSSRIFKQLYYVCLTRYAIGAVCNVRVSINSSIFKQGA
jgi:hypothetical protein